MKINIDNYSGPLEVLLDLAKLQKVDLTSISITQLADQYIKFINSEKKIKLDLAAEYLLMATWLAYLKSKLLLPQDDEEEFKATEVAEKLKLQLKKLELIRLLSDQLLKKERLGFQVRSRGMHGGIKLLSKSKYHVSLYDLLKGYSNTLMKRNFQTMNIPKLPFCTTEQAINILRNNIKNLDDWKPFTDFIPKKFLNTNKLKKSGIAGFFSASLELTKEGLLEMLQKKTFDNILIKERK
jgi:segregation and condensation protein A